MNWKPFIFSLLTLPIALISCSNRPEYKSGLVINEFLALNTAHGPDSIYHEMSDWVEIYNDTNHAIELSGFFLSDDEDDFGQWQFPEGAIIPSKGHYMVYANGLDSANYASFKLSGKKGSIYLCSPDTVVLDAVQYGKQAVNVSQGRKPKQKDTWVFFNQPTPGYENSTPYYYSSERSDLPMIEVTGAESATLTAKEGANIFYTLNSNTPVPSDSLYRGPIAIDQEVTVIRAIAHQEGKLPSLPVTRTIFKRKHTVPVISIVADDYALWDSVQGMYGNSMRRVERMANFEWHEGMDSIQSQLVDVCISGNWARFFGQKAMVVQANEDYGRDRLTGKFYQNKDLTEFHTLLLRGGGHPDKYVTMFKDAMAQDLVAQHTQLDFQGTRLAVVYLNGEYWGLYNIREKTNENFIMDNYKLKKDEFDLIQNTWLVEQSGSADDYREMVDFVRDCEKTPENYSEVGKMMDIDNYINYLICEMYVANIDWPNWNIKFWKAHEGDTLWRWIIMDLDFGLGTGAKSGFDMIGYTTSPVKTRETNPPSATLMPRKMLEFDTFREELIQRMAISLALIYPADRINSSIDNFIAEREPEMEEHLKRWSDSIYHSQWGRFRMPTTIHAWKAEIDRIREYAEQRPDSMLRNWQMHFELSEPVQVKIDPGKGKVLVHDLPVENKPLSALVYPDLTLRCTIPNEQLSAFKYWLVNGEKVKESVLHHTAKAEDEIVAVFKTD